MTPLRLAVLPDFAEEGWPSMDLVAEQFLAQVASCPEIRAENCRPHFRRRFGRVPRLGRGRYGRNADRVLNRFWDYPRAVRQARHRFDFFHVCDHTYSQLVNELPPGRAGVFCHDLDAFRSLLDPAAEPRPFWFRRMIRRVAEGLGKASVVFHGTAEVGRRLAESELVAPERLVLAPYGVAAEFTHAGPRAKQPAGTFLLHVGSCIPRKRIDVLLDVFAATRAARPDVRLVKVGGAWTATQCAQIDRLGLGPELLHLTDLSRDDLAALYRSAALVLVPSEEEGFGLPVIESLACGTPVLASDLPTLREAGGDAANYLPVGDVPAWAHTILELLADPGRAPPPGERLQQASRFTWKSHTRVICDTYLKFTGRA